MAAICTSDTHFRIKPPIARSAEEDWLKAQLRPVKQLKKLAEKYQAPILVGGDFFDKAISSPELVNWLLDNMVPVYAVAGNHDLPEHRHKDIKRSSFYTLVKAGLITEIKPNESLEITTKAGIVLRLWGFPCGFDIVPLSNPFDMYQEIAVVHTYLWTGKPDTGFYGAPEDHTVKAYKSRFNGYDAVIVGDNHLPFCSQSGDTTIINCGGFQQLTYPNENHQPSVWLLREDNSVTRVKLDVSEDKFIQETELERIMKEGKGSAFVEELKHLGGPGVNFAEAIEQAIVRDKIEDEVRVVIEKAMEQK